ncbi:MAG: hypothetical protein AB9891_09640 [Anaerolineaceae bacterium]
MNNMMVRLNHPPMSDRRFESDLIPKTKTAHPELVEGRAVLMADHMVYLLLPSLASFLGMFRGKAAIRRIKIQKKL